MMEQLTLSVGEIPSYGAGELKRHYQKHLKRAFVIAVAAHVLALGAIVTTQKILERPRKMVTLRVVKYSDLGPPPSLSNQQAAPQISVSQPVARPTVGIPEPVPDAEVSEQQTIATQTEMSQMAAPVLGEGAGGEGVQVLAEPPKADTIVVQQEEEVLPAQGEFVPHEEEPVEVSFSIPPSDYPEIAKQAGIEGEVFLQILIDKTGKVRDVRVLKSSFKAFEEVASRAAWRSVWKPAIQNTTPVAVWVTKPVRFRLR